MGCPSGQVQHLGRPRSLILRVDGEAASSRQPEPCDDDYPQPSPGHDPRHPLARLDGLAGLKEGSRPPLRIAFFAGDVEVQERHPVRTLLQLSAPTDHQAEQKQDDQGCSNDGVNSS